MLPWGAPVLPWWGRALVRIAGVLGDTIELLRRR
jgi:hypothetical protein